MFTGIIQDVGEIVRVIPEGPQRRITVRTALDTGGWRLGDSVAVDGCCLTVTGMAEGAFEAVLSPETLAVTVFGEARAGRRVNLEPALRVGDALGGHIVTGHVDGVATLEEAREAGEHRVLGFRAPEALARYLVRKGSVAVNGASLTVNDVDGARFSVNLIPHTLAHTNLGALRPGDAVNLETDLLGRYVERMMQCDARTEAGA